jgi:hypothetical protein
MWLYRTMEKGTKTSIVRYGMKLESSNLCDVLTIAVSIF